ncbi:MAG TPA: DUF6531 domain-containing protein [Pyrinomonadaceae bacterium]|jgi:YD repeat-containing protein
MLGRLKPGRSAALFAATISTAVLLAGLPRAAATNAKPETTPARAKQGGQTCAGCGAGAQSSGLDALSTLGRRSMPTPLLAVRRSASEGLRVSHVGTAGGDLAFAVNDLELGGATPLLFRRVYASDRAEDSGLGQGWSFAFDDRITVEGDEAVLKTGAGGLFDFRREGGGRRFVLKTPEPGAPRSFELTEGEAVAESAAGFTRVYTKLGGAYRLSRVEDAYGNAVVIGFDGRGNVARVEGGGGSALTLRWSAGRDARLLSVTDHTGRRVSFAQDGRRLRSVADAAGARWTYDYDAAGRLTRAADPAGRVLLRARYDPRGRAVESGDAAGAHLFEYETAAGEASRRTVVTDPVGAQAVVSHTPRGAVAAVDDADGRLFEAVYDADGRPARVSDHAGVETTFDYDGEGRLLRRSPRGGAQKAYTYDGARRVASTAEGGAGYVYRRGARGDAYEARGVGGAGGYASTRDARGRLTSLEPSGGRALSFEYDAAGNQTAVTYPGLGRFEAEYDAAGRRIAERAPSGHSYAYEYDARGLVTKRRSGAGLALTFERDASGALAAVSGGGRWVRATRDAAGRVVALTNSERKTRRFAYDARGALTEYVDARGARLSFEYDARGRLRGVTGPYGASLRLTYDRAGRLASVERAPRPGPQAARPGPPAARHPAAAAARFLPAAYEPPAPAAPTDYVCFFDTGDGWTEGDPWAEGYEPDCSDPFGGGELLWGNGGGGVNPESCWKCETRHRRICHSEWSAKYTRALSSDLGLTLACASVTAGTLALVCAAAAGLQAYAQVVAANDEYDACVLKIMDSCRWACMA